MAHSIFFLVLGFVVLIKGADLLVEGASSLAKRLRVSDMVIGLTIVAMGTSAPELFVNIMASYRGSADIAIGNVFGSNIFNILVILGLSVMVTPLVIKPNTAWKEIPLSLLAAVIVVVLANDQLIDRGAVSVLTRIDGIVLLSYFLIFIYYIFELSSSKEKLMEGQVVVTRGLGISCLWVGMGLVGLVLGGKWIVDAAIFLARAWGVSESLIGLTIVAVGTSLPEVATSVTAAYKNNTDIAVGNIVGSNIFNVFWILGISAVIRPLPFSPANNFDGIVMILTTCLLFAAVFMNKRWHIGRGEGIIFLVAYVVYVMYLVHRG